MFSLVNIFSVKQIVWNMKSFVFSLTVTQAVLCNNICVCAEFTTHAL